jgi:quinol monooxygenase YgiN
MSNVVVLAKITAQEGKRAELLEVLKSLVDNAHTEPGTLTYAMHSAVDDDVTIWFYERYADQEALKTHSASSAMKAAGPQLMSLVASRPELIMLNDVANKGF